MREARVGRPASLFDLADPRKSAAQTLSIRVTSGAKLAGVELAGSRFPRKNKSPI